MDLDSQDITESHSFLSFGSLRVGLANLQAPFEFLSNVILSINWAITLWQGANLNIAQIFPDLRSKAKWNDEVRMFHGNFLKITQADGRGHS